MDTSPTAPRFALGVAVEVRSWRGERDGQGKVVANNSEPGADPTTKKVHDAGVMTTSLQTIFKHESALNTPLYIGDVQAEIEASTNSNCCRSSIMLVHAVKHIST